MPKKNWTPEERKAFAEKMKAARAKKTQDVPTQTQDNDVLLKQIEELRKNQELLQAALLGKTGNADKETVGVREKYSMDFESYPDYRDRLAKEARLSRFGFGENFRLSYDVMPTEYQTAAGIWERQPRFIYQLWAVRYDDSGEKMVKKDKNGKPVEVIYAVNRFVFHEDPASFLLLAREAGMDVDNMDESILLDEARYLSVRDWLIDCFYPQPIAKADARREEVIGNSLVEVREISAPADQSIKIDFTGMKKLKV